MVVNNGPYWIGFDLGGTKMLASVLDENFKVISRVRKRTKGHLGADQGIERMADVIEQAIEEANIDSSQVAGLGLGAPGPIDMDKGVLISAPNLGWHDVSLKKKLQEKLKFPVIVLNDVDAGLFGEYRFGAAQEARTVVGVFPGTGIGGACIYAGEILRGKKLSCMEIGHMRVIPDGPLAGSGHRGTLESVASRLAISSSAAQAAYRGQSQFIMDKAKTDLSQIRSGMLADAIESGDKVIKKIVEDAAFQIGISASAIVHILAPDIILLGGGLVEAMPDIFTSQIKKALKEWLLPAYKDTTDVTVAELGDDAAILGAASWAAKKILPEPEAQYFEL